VLFRFLVASFALAILVNREPGPKIGTLNGRQLLNLILMSLIGMVGFTALILEGVKRTTAADAGIITSIMPIVVAILGAVFFRERLGGRQILAVLIAAIGVALLQVTGIDGAERTALGNFLVMGAVICESTFVILAKSLSVVLRPIRLALGANVAGIFLALPLAVPDLAQLDAGNVRLITVFQAIFYALSASVFALLLWYRALPHVETATAGLMTTALPLSAITVSALFLGEKIAATQLIGALFVITALWLGAGAFRRRVR
jgi:drug/metabolite transporter (DMT)-like permease